MKSDLEGILSGLNAVPWATVEHAYGPAVDVPDLIRGVASPVAKTRDEAWYKLHGNLWHQGTVYEATACAVPFFLQLLRFKWAPDRHSILIFLLACLQVDRIGMHTKTWSQVGPKLRSLASRKE